MLRRTGFLSHESFENASGHQKDQKAANLAAYSISLRGYQLTGAHIDAVEGLDGRLIQAILRGGGR